MTKDLLTKTIERLKNIIRSKRFKRLAFVFFIQFFFYMLWLIAFYPGAMSYDSVYQWENLKNNYYESIFPILYSLMIKVIQILNAGPEMVGLIQIIATASIVTAFFDLFYRHGVKKLLCYGMVAFFSLSCIVGIYNITLWKDIFFTQSIALIGLVYLKVYFKEIKLEKGPIFFISLLLVVTASLRMNGLIYIVVAGVFFIFGFWKKKNLLLTAFLSLGICSALIFYLVPSIFSQDNAKAQSMTKVMQLQSMAVIVKMNGVMSPEAKAMVSEVLPLEDFNSRYHCSAADYLYMRNPNIKFDKIDDTLYFKMLRDNLPLVLGDRVCLFGFLTGIGEKTHQSYYWSFIEQNNSGIVQAPSTPLKVILINYLDISQNSFISFVFWSHFLEICIFLILLAYTFIKHEYYKLIFLSLIFINVPFIFLFNVARDFRYLYMLTFCLPFALVLGFVKREKKTGK